MKGGNSVYLPPLKISQTSSLLSFLSLSVSFPSDPPPTPLPSAELGFLLTLVLRTAVYEAELMHIQHLLEVPAKELWGESSTSKDTGWRQWSEWMKEKQRRSEETMEGNLKTNCMIITGASNTSGIVTKSSFHNASTLSLMYANEESHYKSYYSQ